MVETRDLTLSGIDGMRHLMTSEPVVRAIAFAVRHTSSQYRRDIEVDRTAYRFVVAASMVGALEEEGRWLNILDHVHALERAERGTRRLADTRPLLSRGDGAWYDGSRGIVEGVFHGSREYVIVWNETGTETFEMASDILSDTEHAALLSEDGHA